MKRLAVLAVAAMGLTLAGTAFATHSWGGYHWARMSNPFTLKLGDNVSSSWDGYLSTTSSDWSQSTVLDTTMVAGQSSKRRCSATTGRVEVCNGTYGNNGWLGIAQIWLSGSHITQGTVRVNDTYFNLAQYNNVNEKEHVMCQEVGHTLGLDHQSTSGLSVGTCMDYYNNTSATTDTQSTKPNQHDYDELVTIYTHTPPDSTTTILASAPTGPGKGQPQRVRDDLWVEDLGNGVRKFTFVYWVNRGAVHEAPAVDD